MRAGQVKARPSSAARSLVDADEIDALRVDEPSQGFGSGQMAGTVGWPGVLRWP